MATKAIRVDLLEAAAPATPATGDVRLYAKADGLVYSKDDAGVETLVSGGPGGGSAPGNLWTMAKGAGLGDQTLTNNTLTQITFDTAQIDGGGSVIDHANERFVAPATGLYLAFAYWPWGATVPGQASVSVKVGATEALPMARIMTATASGYNFGSMQSSGALALTAGDLLTMWVNPGAITGVIARGGASIHTRTTFTLVRIT